MLKPLMWATRPVSKRLLEPLIFKIRLMAPPIVKRIPTVIKAIAHLNLALIVLSFVKVCKGGEIFHFSKIILLFDITTAVQFIF